MIVKITDFVKLLTIMSYKITQSMFLLYSTDFFLQGKILTKNKLAIV